MWQKGDLGADLSSCLTSPARESGSESESPIRNEARRPKRRREDAMGMGEEKVCLGRERENERESNKENQV